MNPSKWSLTLAMLMNKRYFVLQCVAMRCSERQCVAVSCRMPSGGC